MGHPLSSSSNVGYTVTWEEQVIKISYLPKLKTQYSGQAQQREMCILPFHGFAPAEKKMQERFHHNYNSGEKKL